MNARLARFLAGLGLTAVFGASALLGVALHLNLPASRRSIERIAASALDGAFEGSVELHGLDRLDLDGLALSDVTVRDAAGAVVLRAQEVRLDVDLAALAFRLVHRADLRLDLDLFRIERADVHLDRDASGRMAIAAALTPKPEPHPAPGRPTFVSLRRFEITAAEIHGRPSPTIALDAEVRHLAGTLNVAPGEVSLDVDPAGLTEHSLVPGGLSGTGDYHLRVTGPADPTDTTTPLTPLMWMAFAGRAGQVEVRTSASFDAKHLDATLHLPRVTPDAGKALFPAYPLLDPVAAEVRVEGDLPRLVARASVDSDTRGSVRAEARIDLGPPLRVAWDLTTKSLDPRLFSISAPQVLVTSRGRGQVELGAVVSARADIAIDPTTLDGAPIPAVDATATFDGFTWILKASAREPGAPVDASVTISPGGHVAFDVAAEAPSLAAVTRLPVRLGGSAKARAKGTLAAGRVDASLTAQVTAFRAPGGTSVGHADVRGEIKGQIAAPTELRLDATVQARAVRAGGYVLPRAAIRVQGPLDDLRFRVNAEDDRRTDIEAAGRVDARGKAARHVSLRVEREGVVATGSVRRVGVRPGGGFAIEGVSLQGLGSGDIEGSLALANGELRGALRGKGVDLGRVGQILALRSPLEGQADLDVALTPTKQGRAGHVRATLRGVGLGADGAANPPKTKDAATDPQTQTRAGLGAKDASDLLRGLGGTIEVTFDGARVTTTAEVTIDAPGGMCVGPAATLRVIRSEGALQGPLLARTTWEGATGSADVEIVHVQLSCISAMAGGAARWGALGGHLDGHATLSRLSHKEARGWPSIEGLRLRTTGLTVVGPPPKDEADPRWTSHGLDVAIAGAFDATTGEARAEVKLLDASAAAEAEDPSRGREARAAPIALGATATVDLDAILDEPRRKAAILAMPITVSLVAPARDRAALDAMPSFVTEVLPHFTGKIGLDLKIAGTVGAPSADLRFAAVGLGAPDPADGDAAWSVPIDAEITAHYDGATARAHAAIAARRAEVASADATVRLPFERLLAGTPLGEPEPAGTESADPASNVRTWDADVTARFAGAPLDGLAALADRDVRGRLRGDVAILGLGSAPSIQADLAIEGLAIGAQGLSLPEANLAVRATSDGASAKLHLRDNDGGSLDFAGFLGLTWRAGAAPEVARDRPADAFVRLSRFQLAALQPFVGDALRRLDGTIDGDARLGWRARSSDGGEAPPNPGAVRAPSNDGGDAKIACDLRIKDASVYVPQIGQDVRLRDRGAGPVRVRADKDGTFRVTGIDAEIGAGRARGWIFGRLDGLRPRDAVADLTIGEDESLPITLEGVPLGRVSGEATIAADLSPGRVNIAVGTRKLRFVLPPSTSRDVMPLDDHPDIALSHALKRPEGAREARATTIAVTVRLGDTIVEGKGARIALATAADAPIRITLGDKLQTSGDILLNNGTVEVLGNKFEVDSGMVTLRERDPANPYVNVAAHWDAPDGSRIGVRYQGVLRPITNDKLRFESTPARTQQEILAVLVLGADLEQGTAAGGTAAPGTTFQQAAQETALNVGGELASAQINQILSGIGPLKGLSARVGTADSGALKTTVSYRVSDNVSAQASFEGSAPAATTAGNASSTGASTSVSLEWRFSKNWLLRGAFGVDATNRPSSALDVIWQYRY